MAAILVPNETEALSAISTEYLILGEEDTKRADLIVHAFENHQEDNYINTRHRLLKSIQIAVYHTPKSLDGLNLTLDIRKHR